MKRLTWCISVIMVGVLVAAMVFAGCAAPKETTVYKWRLTSPFENPLATERVDLNKMADKIRERTGGRLDISTHGFAQLGYKGPDTFRMMKDALIEMTIIPAGHVAGDEPICDLYQLVFLVDTLPQLRTLTKVARPYIEKTFEKHNAKYLGAYSQDPVEAIGSKPIVTLDQMKGVKMRVASAAWGDAAKALGMSTVTTAYAEAYTALQTRIIDANLGGTNANKDAKFYEVAKQASMLDWSAWVNTLAVNKSAFSSLPADFQKILVEAASDFETNHQDVVFQSLEADIKFLKDQGVTFHYPTAEERAKMVNLVRPTWDTWLAKSGPEGKEALNKVLVAIGKPTAK